MRKYSKAYLKRLLKYHYRIYNDYSIDAIVDHVTKYNENEQDPGNLNPLFTQEEKDKLISWLMKELNRYLKEIKPTPANGELYEFELKAYDKWFGKQGKTPCLNTVLELLQPYYANVQIPINPLWISEEVKMKLYDQLTTNRLFTTKPNEDVRPWNQIKYYNELPTPSHKSNSGVIGFTDRRDPDVRHKAYIHAKVHNKDRLDPPVIGTRHIRNKFRLIFMDSLSNWFIAYPQYARLANYFKNSASVNYGTEDDVSYTITKFLNKHNPRDVIFFESDYESMDTWVRLEHTEFVFSILAEIFNDDYLVSDEVKNINKNLFTQEVITPCGIKNGLHSLLSGLLPTNYVETPLNLTILTDWLDYIEPELLPGVDYVIIVIGDDSLILIDKKKMKNKDIDLQSSFSQFVWEKYKIKANQLKQRVSDSSGFFCKRQYQKSGSNHEILMKTLKEKDVEYNRSIQVCDNIYPMVLVLNSILNPERASKVYQKPGLELIALFARLDNAKYHPMYNLVAQRVLNLYIRKLGKIQIDEELVDEYNKSNKASWRIKLFGEQFDPTKSPTATLYSKLIK